MKKKQRFDYILILIFMIGLFCISVFATNHFFKKEIIQQQQEALHKKEQLLAKNIPTSYFTATSLENTEEAFLLQYFDDQVERLTLLNSVGEIIYDSKQTQIIHESRKKRPEIDAVISGAAYGSSLRMSTTVKHELLYLAVPVKKNGKIIGIIRIAEKTSQFSNNINTFRGFILIILGSLFFVITIFMLLLLKQKNKPIATILPVLKRMISEPEKSRAIIEATSEWNELYQTVNLLGQQVSQTYLAYTSTDEQFHSLIDELQIGVLIIASDGSIEMINPSMLAFLSKQATEYKNNENYLTLIHDAQLIQFIHQVIEQESSLHKELTIFHGETERILDFSLRYIPKENADYQLLGIAYDLTRVRQLEKIQKDFVSNVSHELKTPVTSVLGFTETLLDGAKDDPIILEEFLLIIQNNAQRLQQLIQEIIQLSHDGKMHSYEQQNLLIEATIQEIVASYQQIIRDKQLSILVNGEAKLSLQTKPELFYPIVKNLIENAVQYTPENGEITIFYGNTSNDFTLSVTDNGQGIHQEELQRIFERFYRVNKARTRHTGGTGLGLAIVKNYAELLKGSISVESHLGLGTTFTLTLPLSSSIKKK